MFPFGLNMFKVLATLSLAQNSKCNVAMTLLATILPKKGQSEIATGGFCLQCTRERTHSNRCDCFFFVVAKIRTFINWKRKCRRFQRYVWFFSAIQRGSELTISVKDAFSVHLGPIDQVGKHLPFITFVMASVGCATSGANTRSEHLVLKTKVSRCGLIFVDMQFILNSSLCFYLLK